MQDQIWYTTDKLLIAPSPLPSGKHTSPFALLQYMLLVGPNVSDTFFYCFQLDL